MKITAYLAKYNGELRLIFLFTDYILVVDQQMY